MNYVDTIRCARAAFIATQHQMPRVVFVPDIMVHGLAAEYVESAACGYLPTTYGYNDVNERIAFIERQIRAGEMRYFGMCVHAAGDEIHVAMDACKVH